MAILSPVTVEKLHARVMDAAKNMHARLNRDIPAMEMYRALYPDAQDRNALLRVGAMMMCDHTYWRGRLLYHGVEGCLTFLGEQSVGVGTFIIPDGYNSNLDVSALTPESCSCVNVCIDVAQRWARSWAAFKFVNEWQHDPTVFAHFCPWLKGFARDLLVNSKPKELNKEDRAALNVIVRGKLDRAPAMPRELLLQCRDITVLLAQKQLLPEVTELNVAHGMAWLTIPVPSHDWDKRFEELRGRSLL